MRYRFRRGLRRKCCCCLATVLIVMLVASAMTSQRYLEAFELRPSVLFPAVVQPRQQFSKTSAPTIKTPPPIWPSNGSGDRVINQLNLVIPNITKPSHHQNTSDTGGLKVIYLEWISYYEKELGRERFLADKCNVDTCFLTKSLPVGRKIDAVISTSTQTSNISGIDQDTVYIYYQLEAPCGTYELKKVNTPRFFNWTATYRHDSTIVTPYAKFVQDNEINYACPIRNYARTKTKMVAWFVSNCDVTARMNYAHDLKKHISVDIYGKCGNMRCPRTSLDSCFRKLDADYKFYLAFENTHCKDYITEKLYLNGLGNDVVPIVMGAHPDDYRKVAPPHSYIHVDDFENPQDLARYLHKLDKNDTLYNEYFRWKGTGSFIDTKFWCRLCAMLHARERDNYVHWYEDIHKWWAEGSCLTPDKGGSWLNHAFAPIRVAKKLFKMLF